MTEIEIKDGDVSLDEMHDITDVVHAALHDSFHDRVLDGRALVGALIASALGILRDIDANDPKETVKQFVDDVNLDDIMPFDPSKH